MIGRIAFLVTGIPMEALQRAAQLFHQALAAQQAGRLDEAERFYREALALAPDRPSVLLNLSGVLLQMQRFAEALRLSERVLQLQPGHPDALQNAALCRRQLYGGDALGLLEQAVAARPQDVEALSNLALAQREAGRLDEALATLDRALAIDPGRAGALANRAALHAERGRLPQAQADYLDALALDPELEAAQRGFFVLCATPGFEPFPDDTRFRQRLAEAVAAPWGRPQALVPLCLALLSRDPRIAAQMAGSAQIGADWSDASDSLLRALLPRAVLTDLAFEDWFVALRVWLLATAEGESGGAADGARLGLHCAIAAQAHLAEYIAPVGEPETSRIARIEERLCARADAGDVAIPPRWIAAFASYAPLASLRCVEALAARRWPPPVDMLFAEQHRASVEEARLRAGIGRLTAIDDATSVAVQAQYESNPYPRWSALPRTRDPQGLAAFLAARLPGLGRQTLAQGGALRVLVAGCGTGQQPIETALGVANAEVLAVDLSLASLAYARRQAQAMGVSNLRFAQADILRLGQCGLSFDLIECSGVLHHLAEPSAGLAVLVGLLRPGGFLRLGLYSERGRRAVVAARERIAGRGWRDDLDGMRACRADIRALPAEHPARGVLAFGDFFAASPCRDLLFHVQEHRFKLPQIAAMLRAHPLSFLGFELAPATREAFLREHGAPGALQDIDAWDRFEAAHPDCFAAMYQFWLRRD